MLGLIMLMLPISTFGIWFSDNDGIHEHGLADVTNKKHREM